MKLNTIQRQNRNTKQIRLAKRSISFGLFGLVFIMLPSFSYVKQRHQQRFSLSTLMINKIALWQNNDEKNNELVGTNFKHLRQPKFYPTDDKSQTNPPIKLRILTHNIYGLSKEDCSVRLKTIGRRIARARPKYDIIGFQEFYNAPAKTCEPNNLNFEIWASRAYQNSDNYYRYYPEVGSSPLNADLGINGGVGIFTLHHIVEFHDWEWDNDNQGRVEAKEGFIFARISISNSALKVDAYIVHLNSGSNRDRRKKQLQQLANAIKKYSSQSGNPVVVMGDFNIGGPPSNNGNEGYSDIMDILRRPEDLWMKSHPGENGFSIDCKVNNVNSNNCDDQERIDYIFVLTDAEFTNSPYMLKISNKQNVKVVQWELPRDHRGDSKVRDHRSRYVSDHFGLEATIDIHKTEVRDHRNRGRVRDHRDKGRVRDHRS